MAQHSPSWYVSKGDKVSIWKRYLTPMFIAALLTIAKTTWKHPKCPMTDKWMKNQCNRSVNTVLHSIKLRADSSLGA